MACLLGLNDETRCQARRRLLRQLENARKAQDQEALDDLARGGPYRFIARFFLNSL